MFELVMMLMCLEDGRPHLCDVDKFPSRTVVSASLEFNRAYRGQLELQRSLYMERDPRYTWYSDAIKETDQLYEAWQLLSIGIYNRDTKYVNLWTREQLQKLREMIGDDNFFNGRMPPPVPIWRFREVP